MSATDERGRVLAHEAVARCLAEYDTAQASPGHRCGVVLAFSAARAARAARRAAGGQPERAPRAQLRFSPLTRQQAD